MIQQSHKNIHQQNPKGLYHPEFEHDACGVGMICHLGNRKSHTLIADALQILVNLTHRGACGCDQSTGGGAGILMQTPHAFLKKSAATCPGPDLTCCY